MMTDALARITQISALPLIDIGGLGSAKPLVRAGVVAAIRDACLSKGFFYITGHGIAPALVEAVLRESRAFFDLPLVERLRVRRECSICHRGYEPMGGQDLEQTGTPDLKEAFYLGVDLPEDDPRVLARKVNHGPNQWPRLPGFRNVMEDYFAAMLDLSVRLMGAIALSLDLAEDHFAGFCSEAVALLRLLHYPQQRANGLPSEKGCGAHTDWGAITLLLQDDAGGLQIRDPAHGWLHAPPLHGTFVVNIGDLISRWTNDRYHSTEHRVINLSGRDRYSVPFFFDGNPDHVVTCLPGCSDAGNPPKYRPTTVAEHTDAMHRATFVAV